MRKLFFLFTFCAGILTAQAQTFNNGLTNTGGTGAAAVVRLGGTITSTSPVIDLGTTFTFGINKGTVSYFSVINNGNIGIGVPTPLSLLHIKSGTSTAAPLLFTTGVNLTTPLAGAMEYNGTSLLFTPTTALGRKTIAYTDLTNLSGILPILNGGTSFSTYATGDIIYASAANVLSKRTIGALNQVLTVQGGVPTWATPSFTGITGTLPVANGGTGAIANTGVLIGNGTAATTAVAGAASQYLRRNAANTAYEFAAITGSTGTVTSIGLTVPTGFSVAPATITNSGTFTITTALNGLLRGNGTGFTTGQANLATEVTGTLPILNGGTGATTAAAALTALLPTQSAATSGQVLKSNGTAAPTWATVTGTGTVTNASIVTANGISGTVATSTTTPAITLSLGAITPTSVAATGTVTGSNLSNVNGANTGDNAPNTLYSGLVSNATHTGDVTGSTALSLATVNANVGSFTNANITVNVKGLITAASNGVGGITTETDPVVKAINGLVKSNGTTISAATAGTDYLTPTGSAAGLTNFPILNQNTTGTAATITGTITQSQVTNLIADLATKQANITLTTIGTSGAATFSANTLNIPNYANGITNTAWGLLGNTGTNSTNNFIGTTDAQRLVFKTSGIEYATILANGNFGIGIANPSTKLEVKDGNIVTNQNIYASSANSRVLIGNMTGLNTGTHALAVNGTALFTKATVRLTGTWPDYVFEPTNKLPTLAEVEAYITKHKHLEGVPSAAEVKEKGIDLGDNQTVLLKKVEELTLYMIELNKKVEVLAKENEELKQKVNGDK